MRVISTGPDPCRRQRAGACSDGRGAETSPRARLRGRREAPPSGTGTAVLSSGPSPRRRSPDRREGSAATANTRYTARHRVLSGGAHVVPGTGNGDEIHTKAPGWL